MPDRHDNEDGEDYFNVAVPRGAYPEVINAVNRYLAGGDPRAVAPVHGEPTDGADATDPVEVEVPKSGLWSRADIKELHRSYRNERGRAVVSLIAHRSLKGEEAYYGELMDHADLDTYKLRAQLSWLVKKSQVVKGKSGVWPIVVTDNGSEEPPGRRYSYYMPREVAQWWLEEEGS